MREQGEHYMPGKVKWKIGVIFLEWNRVDPHKHSENIWKVGKREGLWIKNEVKIIIW
jgi:hypothetical protein